MSNNNEAKNPFFYKLPKAVYGSLNAKANETNLVECIFDVNDRIIEFTISKDDFDFLISSGFLTVDTLNTAYTQIIGGDIPNYLE